MAKYEVVPVPTRVERWRPSRRSYVWLQGYTVRVDGIDSYPFLPYVEARALAKKWREEEQSNAH